MGARLKKVADGRKKQNKKTRRSRGTEKEPKKGGVVHYRPGGEKKVEKKEKKKQHKSRGEEKKPRPRAASLA